MRLASTLTRSTGGVLTGEPECEQSIVIAQPIIHKIARTDNMTTIFLRSDAICF